MNPGRSTFLGRRESGVHRGTSESIDRCIRQLFIRYLFSTARGMRRWLPPQAGGFLSTQTIRRRLHEVKLARVPATGVLLTTKHKERCLVWCHRHCTGTIEWHRVLFTEESRFCLWRNDGCRLVWWNATDQPISTSIKLVQYRAS
ncbi:hypothetical protein TNCV_1547241 [Trichonephila clavipes]|nr:hypothetical protein TNCV_1547241 [Trichonephila clavipes]